MDKYAASPNLAATTLALLILADFFPSLSAEPTDPADAFRHDDNQRAATLRHRRHRP